MQPPHPPRPPYPPRPGSGPGDSDRDLVAQLRGTAEDSHRAVALLLARHWRATCDYAVICLSTSTSSAQLVATSAFSRVLGRLSGGAVGGALRPQLLVAVRETVRAWAADDVIPIVLPELRKPNGGRGLRAAMPGTPERRQLAERAFRALPGASQCLLWHTEVEAEPINIPAGLLGVDTATASAALKQSREQFRVACVRAHRELAPTKECRFYNRLLEVPIHRGAALLPDVRRHLVECRYCRYAAEQLSHFADGLDVLLAETVLGWGARRYLDSRAGRGTAEERPPAPVPVHPAAGGRHRTASGGRRRKALVIGVGLTCLALLATVLAARSWSDERGVPRPHATWGAPSGSSARPSAGHEAPPVPSPSAASAGRTVEVGQGRLRSRAAGLCLDVRGGRARDGARALLAACSFARSQQWSYEDDGMLRNGADPALCLAADPDTRSVVLAGCVVHAGEVSYDLTVRGELLLRRPGRLAVAPGSGASRTHVTVTARDGSERQRWTLEPLTGQAPPKAPGGGTPRQPAPEQTSAPAPPGADAPQDRPAPPPEDHRTRIAQVGCCADTGPAETSPAPPTDIVGSLTAPVGDLASVPSGVTGSVTTVVSAFG
ncbi:ricin-type beta-trefoil lectin domain protein [Streptomyces sp. NPDC001480]|uniref:ricin-type beta-trefoil lectin domain protein n=1 Tax=Streptomyces sp. NPDC001480 TaxID=3364577 RepID=UPI00367FF1F2